MLNRGLSKNMAMITMTPVWQVGLGELPDPWTFIGTALIVRGTLCCTPDRAKFSYPLMS
jgi:hypothetical protein